MIDAEVRGRRRSRRGGGAKPTALRDVNYRNLRTPFPPMDVFSADQIGAMHDTALRTLEDLGMRVLLPEAIEIFRKGGARLEDDMVYIGREMVVNRFADTCRACPRKCLSDRSVLRWMGSARVGTCLVVVGSSEVHGEGVWPTSKTSSSRNCFQRRDKSGSSISVTRLPRSSH